MQGCPYVVAIHKQTVGGLLVNERCGKIPADDSEYCPKHVLMKQEQEEKSASFPQRMKEAKELKKAKLAALAASPLAVHPENETGYER